MQKLSKNARRTALGASVGVVVVGAAVGVAGIASAAPTPTPTSPSSSAASAPAEPGPGGRGDRGHGPRDGGQLAAQLATRLGLDQAKVTTALQEVREASRPTTKPTPTPGATATPRDPAAQDATLAASLAPKLGVDEAKVKTALDEIRAAQVADRAKALDDRLAAAVKAGTLTQAEADAVKKAAEKGVIGYGPR